MSLLTVLGASPDEDRVYQSLVAAVSATVEEMRKATALPRDDVVSALANLMERGLASEMPDSPPRFVAASPSVVEARIAGRLEELRTAQSTLDDLASQYRAKSLARAESGVFEIVHGQEALRQCSLNMLSSARSEILNLVKPPTIAVQPAEGFRPVITVRGRAIFETQALEHTENLSAIQEGMRGKDEVRVHTKLPIKMLVVDRSSALLPLAQQDTTPVGVLVHESATLDAFCALFEYVWETAVPLHIDDAGTPESGQPSVLSFENRQLLSLLLAGLTDEAIAGHQGTSVRTVQRKVQALMTAAHVRTRMQLAWEAARRSWV